ncbi:MAG: signal recognition particle-docking protein FtsY [Cyanobacteriota bacterium]|nr:signal recognition particle-docking protein FtsY [Cyanobacteriota bacterium]
MVFNWFRRKFDDDSEKKSSEKISQEQTPSPEVQPESAESEDTASDATSAEDYLKWAKAAYQNIQAQQKATGDTQEESSEESEVTEAAQEIVETVATAEAEAVEETVETETEAPVAAEAVTPVEESQPETATSEEESVAEAAEQSEPEPEVAAEPEVVAEPEVTEEVTETEAVEEAGDVPAAAEAETPVEQSEPEPEIAVSEESAVEAADETPDETSEAIASENDEAVSSEPAETPEETPALSLFEKARAERQARLERLKETAVETPVPEEPAAATTVAEPEVEIPELPFDDGFVWSAEVLAAQGRRPEDISIEEITWLKKLRQGLDKTRRGLINQLKSIVGQGPLNKEAVMEIEALLLQADVGIEATDFVIESLQGKMREETLPPDAAIAYLKKILRDMLDRPLQENHKPSIAPEKDSLNIWLMTGVNGAGKTTTIGKLAHLAKTSEYRCLIAAADTFRAAAVEQVKVWGARSNTEVIANPGQNTDPAAVVFDGIAAARSRQTELLLVDTAGRLQNKKNLMDELNKIRRIIDRKAPDATVESLLVLDATLGQNGLRQAEVFAEAAQVSGVVLTKLDGTAKGGVALAVVQQLGLPIRFIGAGEGIEDLRPFSSYEFVEALLNG